MSRNFGESHSPSVVIEIIWRGGPPTPHSAPRTTHSLIEQASFRTSTAMHRNLIHRSSALAQSASLYNNERLLARGFGATAQRQTPPDPPSLVKSFLYGSEKGQEMQREMEQSYSKVLARGKYVHKMNQHHVRPDKINEYIALMYPPLVPHRTCPPLSLLIPLPCLPSLSL